MSYDVEALQTKALEFANQAKRATQPSDREHLTTMARSWALLAKNAQWLDSTDRFITGLHQLARRPSPIADVRGHL